MNDTLKEPAVQVRIAESPAPPKLQPQSSRLVPFGLLTGGLLALIAAAPVEEPEEILLPDDEPTEDLVDPIRSMFLLIRGGRCTCDACFESYRELATKLHQARASESYTKVKKHLYTDGDGWCALTISNLPAPQYPSGHIGTFRYRWDPTTMEVHMPQYAETATVQRYAVAQQLFRALESTCLTDEHKAVCVLLFLEALA